VRRETDARKLHQKRNPARSHSCFEGGCFEGGLTTRRLQPHHVTPNLLMGATDKQSGPLLPGTLDMLILKTLSREPMHGYGIALSIQRASQEALKVEEGALYPALHRLEVRGLLKAEWGTSDNNRRAKYYRLTATGRRELEREAAEWNRTAGAIMRVMQTA